MNQAFTLDIFELYLSWEIGSHLAFDRFTTDLDFPRAEQHGTVKEEEGGEVDPSRKNAADSLTSGLKVNQLPASDPSKQQAPFPKEERSEQGICQRSTDCSGAARGFLAVGSLRAGADATSGEGNASGEGNSHRRSDGRADRRAVGAAQDGRLYQRQY
jgi:hypothetical protein